MKVIEVTHPIQEDQLIRRRCDGIWLFDGMHRGHHKVFEALDERAAAQNLKGSNNIRSSSFCCVKS